MRESGIAVPAVILSEVEGPRRVTGEIASYSMGSLGFARDDS